MRLPAGTLTFLFTDIEGSTRLWEDFPEAMRSALARHDAILKQAIEQHNGFWVKSTGDGLLTAFKTVPEALWAALDAQRYLKSQAWEEPLILRVRMALHVGAVQERDNDYFGPALNRVARLLAIGHGEQVLLSLPAEELVKDNLPEGCSLKDLGSHRLKDLSQPEHVFQLLAAGLPAEFPPLRSLQAFANNLPVQLTSFIGRDKEIDEVKALLTTTHLLTLTGSGGCGKTRLALQVAADVIETYPDGVWLVELAALAEESLIPQALASALGVREEPGRALTETLTSYLQPRSLLLLLDNCEHLIADCARLADGLLRACPHLQILATSREALHLGGETSYRVPSLQQPEPKKPSGKDKAGVSALMGYDAVRLFVERACSSRTNFALTEHNGTAVVEVCHRLEGIPLAIELAAARVRMMSVEQIASRLDERFRLLTGGSRTAPSRHQTLQATLDWSYDLLSENERRLLRGLSVFAGGWTFEAAEQVCTGEGVEEEQILDVLTSLVDKSLVIYEEQEGRDRYRLLETVRQYSWERMEESEELAVWRDRHLDFFLKLAEEGNLNLQGREQATWLERLEADISNFRAALDWSLTDPEGIQQKAAGNKQHAVINSPLASSEVGLRLTVALSSFWSIRGHLHEGRTYTARALAWGRSSEVAGTTLQAEILDRAGHLAMNQADYAAARNLFEESLSLWQALGDRPHTAALLTGLGMIAFEQGDHAEARRLHEQALAIGRELADRQAIAASLHNLAMPLTSQGNFMEAHSLVTEALEINREMGNPGWIAKNLEHLGLIARSQGDYTTARRFFEESLPLFRQVGHRAEVASLLVQLGIVARQQGDYSRARSLHEESLMLYKEIGNRHGIANAFWTLGNLAMAQQDLSTAQSYFSESLTLFREFEVKPGVAGLLGSLGRVAQEQGNDVAAQGYYQEALLLFQNMGEKQGLYLTLKAFAGLAARRERQERSVRLYCAAEVLRESLGAAMSPEEQKSQDQHLSAIRSLLGEEIFAVLWEQGRALTTEQAIEYALEEDIS